MPFLPSLPDDALLTNLFLAYPEICKPLVETSDAIMTGPSPFTIGERELIATYVCALNDCDYCYRTHRTVAEEFGVDGAVIDAVLDDLDAATVDPRLKPVLRHAAQLTATPMDVDPAVVEAIYAAGWDEAAVMHTVAVCALFNFMTRLIEGTGLVGSDADFAAAGKRFRERGYAGLVERLEAALAAKRAAAG
jgi:uncharacterized peroxidase-related enzyme